MRRLIQRVLLSLFVVLSMVIAVPPARHVSAAATISTLTNGMAAVDGGTSVTTTPTASWAVGDYIIAITASDTALTTAKIAGLGTAGADLILNADATGSNSGNVITVIWSAKVITAGSNQLVTFSNANTDVKCCIIYKATGLASSAFDKPASNTGTGTAPSSGATATTTQADELLIAGIGQEDDNDAESTGTWNGSFSAGTNSQKTGVDSGGSASDIVVQAATSIVTATAVYTASKNSVTSCDWGACIATYKVAATVPTVTTQAVSAIAATTATGNGTVVDRGIPSQSGLTERGICWSSVSNPPTTSDSSDHDHIDSTGAYTISMTSLTLGTLYYVRAYAINATGTGYGGTVTFYTLPGDPSSLASPSQTETTIDLTWTKGTGCEWTMIRMGTSDYPLSISDGIEVYCMQATSATVPTTTNRIRPTSYNDVDSAWTNESVAYDYYFGSSATGTAGHYCEFPHSALSCTYIALILGAFSGTNYTVGYYDTSWHDSSPSIELDGYTEISLGGSKSISNIRVKVQTGTAEVKEVAYGQPFILTSSTTYYFRAWGYDLNSNQYSSGYTSLTQATSSGGTPDISNLPATWTLNGITGSGKININTTYYANPLGDTTPPSATVQNGECRFTLTNSSSMATDITVNCSDFSGGSNNMTNSNTGSNGATSYGGYSWYAGMTYTNKVIMKTSGSSVLYSNLPALTNLLWGAEIKTQQNAWAGPNASTATMTITATVH